MERVRGDSTSCTTPERDSLTRDREGGAIGVAGHISAWCVWPVSTHGKVLQSYWDGFVSVTAPWVPVDARHKGTPHPQEYEHQRYGD